MTRLSLVRVAVLAALLGSVVPVRMFAQPPEHKAVQEAVEAFLLHLGDGEFDKVAADMSAKALIVVVRQREGKSVNTYETGDAWVASLKRNTNFSKFREPITNVKITIDSDALAYLRADFQVVRDGKTLSHGVDQFTLVREDGRWKIASVAYTSIARM